MKEKRIAALVDGDNVSPKFSEIILEHASKLGRIDIARVYVAANQPSDWFAAPGFRSMNAGAGKNASDLLLTIDAMEIALTSGFDGFVIATSDLDFTHLSLRLREHGLFVLGLGENKAPNTFRRSCSQFNLLPVLDGKTTNRSKGSTSEKLDQKIREMIAQHSKNGQGMLIRELAPKMHSAHGTKISTHKERTWRAYLTGRPDLFEVEPRGPDAKVRFLPDGFR